MQTVLPGVIVFTKGEIQFSILLPTDWLRLPVPPCVPTSDTRSPANVRTESLTIGTQEPQASPEACRHVDNVLMSFNYFIFSVNAYFPARCVFFPCLVLD